MAGANSARPVRRPRRRRRRLRRTSARWQELRRALGAGECRARAYCRSSICCASAPAAARSTGRSRPARSSVVSGARPLNGTCSMSMPALVLNSSPARCAPEPLPIEPKVSAPGLAFAIATSRRRLRREILAHHQHVRHGGDAGDRSKIPHRVVRPVLDQALVGGMGLVGAENQRVAVGLGARHRAGADDARRRRGGSRPRPAARGRPPPPGAISRASDVDRPARRVGHDDGDGAARESLGAGGSGQAADGKAQRASRGGCSIMAFPPFSNPVPVRNLDHPGAPGKLLDQRVGGGAVVGIEIGVPFVEQIDRRVGVADDLPQRAQLPLAGGEARACLARRQRLAVLVGLDLVLRLARTGTPAGRRSASSRRAS